MRSKAFYFTEEDDNMIIKHMKTYGKFTNRFVIISGLLNEKFTCSQISERWRNYLNPELCKDDLGYYEKVIIDHEVQKFLMKGDKIKIRWRKVIRELFRLFGKLYSENKVKNYWNMKYRKGKREVETKILFI
uniref:HTH myb-type domain-containing protein n=1 Tax=Rhizophagus irregularis (strain DAOM 181602 / DAOM 197198 / MUCL 43194) TaxID=747089 RepID=U9SRD5_RHIID